ncbi:MAG: hypothetical protein MUO19_06050 [Dehalococcoidales bacterium]|nr:hypothetical protein [Dehalococcoidales bacterium]
MADSKYGKYIVTELKAPDAVMAALGEYARFGKRILWMDSNVVEGAFQMNCSWYLKPTTRGPAAHSHDVDEIIGFFGNNPEDPYDLGGEIEFWLEDEKYLIDKTAMIFVPAGMKHCPLILRKVDRPIFHFSTITSGNYTQQK